MAISWDDFDKIWASTSPLTPYSFSDNNYKQGWNFIGSTPPARQMWDSIQKANDEKFKFLRDNFGTPNIVTTASQMTDTNKVYVYMGSEAGWSNGHWYYWNGTTWADGGVYNSVAFVTDTTLSIAGQPADAKATGDALALKSDLAGCTFTGNVGINADLSVTGASTLAGNITTSGDISADNISATTNGTVGGNLSVTGTSTLTGNINAGADISAVGDVSADNLTTTTNATVGGSLSVAGTSTLTGNVTTNGNINAVGDISSANLTTTNATIGGNATVTGDVSCANLTTSTDASVGGDLTVTGDSTLADTTVNDLVVNNDLSVAGDSSLTNLFVSGTTALNGNSTAITQPIDDNSTKIATTEYVQAEIKPIEADVSANDKRISNIEKLLQGNLYDYQTDTDSAYTKTVPAGAMPYAGLEKLGGKTLVWNQLCLLNTSITSQHGVTFTINDGVITTSGTADADFFVVVGGFRQNAHASVGDKLLFKMTPTGTAETFYVTIAKPSWSNVYSSVIYTKARDTSDQSIRFVIKSGTNMDGKQFSFVGVNLTKMFGAGNEPSTVAEFESMFPADYYEYNAGTLLSAGVTSVESVGKNLADFITGSGNANGVVWETSGGSSVSFNGTNQLPSSQSWINVKFNALPKENVVAKIHNAPTNLYSCQLRGGNVTGRENFVGNLVNNGVVQTGTRFNASVYKFYSLDIGIYYGGTINGTATFQVEKGSTATEYSPYQEHSYSIPASIQALEGYGWSARNAYNYIDYERKVFVKNVGKVTVTSADVPAADSGNIGSGTFSGGKYLGRAFTYIRNLKYSLGGTFSTFKSGGFSAVTPFASSIDINDSGIISTQFRTYFIDIPDRDTLLAKIGDGVDMYYELATPVETDISEYLTDDNLIQVESGGTLTFENQHGDDYRIPVPSEETYMINLQEAVSNG